MGSSGTSASNTIQYSPYIENTHALFIAGTSLKSIVQMMNEQFGNVPTTSLPSVAAAVELTSVTPVFPMHKTLMQDLDPMTLIHDTLEDIFHKSQSLVRSTYMIVDEFESDMYDFSSACRDINCVSSSFFPVQRAIMAYPIVQEISALLSIGNGAGRGFLQQSKILFDSSLFWRTAVVFQAGVIQKNLIFDEFRVTIRRLTFEVSKIEWDLRIFAAFAQASMNPGGFTPVKGYEISDKQFARNIVKNCVVGIATVIGSIYGVPWLGLAAAAVVTADEYLRDKYGFNSIWMTGGLTIGGMIFDSFFD